SLGTVLTGCINDSGVDRDWVAEFKRLGLAPDLELGGIYSLIKVGSVTRQNRLGGFHPGQGSDIRFRSIDEIKILEAAQVPEEADPLFTHPVIPVLRSISS